MKYLILFLIILFPSVTLSQPLNRRANYDISKERVLYTVGYTHLNSEYEWDYKTTVNEYLKNTMEENYRLFDLYPDYVYNFTGSRRYRLLKEYHPESYKKLKGYIDQGRWCVSGSSVEEAEVNVSSPESVIRQILYGNNLFREEFGKESVDYNMAYQYSCIFKYEIDMAGNASSLKLPENKKIKIFAITVGKNVADDIQILQPISDDFSDDGSFELRKTGKLTLKN